MDYDLLPGSLFQIVIELEGRSAQLVYIASKTYRLDPFEAKEVSAGGFSSDDTFPAEVANALLIYNGSEALIGAWRLHAREFIGGWSAMFTVQIAADSTSSALKTAIFEAARASDAIDERYGDAFGV